MYKKKLFRKNFILAPDIKSPRLKMFGILLFTGYFAFMLSWVLNHVLEINSMAIRYPLVILGSYPIFLVLIYLWLSNQDDGIKKEVNEDQKHEIMGIDDKKNESKWWHNSDFSGFGDFFADELGLILFFCIIAGFIFYGMFSLLTLVTITETIIAELCMEMIILGGSMKLVFKKNFTEVMLKNTFSRLIVIMCSFGVLGFILGFIFPKATSIFDILRGLYGL